MMCGDEKNFPWCENPTADLLLLPNLQEKSHKLTFGKIRTLLNSLKSHLCILVISLDQQNAAIPPKAINHVINDCGESRSCADGDRVYVYLGVSVDFTR